MGTKVMLSMFKYDFLLQHTIKYETNLLRIQNRCFVDLNSFLSQPASNQRHMWLNIPFDGGKTALSCEVMTEAEPHRHYQAL